MVMLQVPKGRDIYLVSMTGRAFLVRCKVHGWASEVFSAQHLPLTFKSQDKNPQASDATSGHC